MASMPLRNGLRPLEHLDVQFLGVINPARGDGDRPRESLIARKVDQLRKVLGHLRKRDQLVPQPLDEHPVADVVGLATRRRVVDRHI